LGKNLRLGKPCFLHNNLLSIGRLRSFFFALKLFCEDKLPIAFKPEANSAALAKMPDDSD